MHKVNNLAHYSTFRYIPLRYRRWPDAARAPCHLVCIFVRLTSIASVSDGRSPLLFARSAIAVSAYQDSVENQGCSSQKYPSAYIYISYTHTFSTYPSTTPGSGRPGCRCWAAIRTADSADALWILFTRCFILSLLWKEPGRERFSVPAFDSEGERTESLEPLLDDADPFVTVSALRGNVEALLAVKLFSLWMGFSVDFLRWLLTFTPGGATYF